MEKKIIEAKNFFQKLKGLMFKKNFDYILKIRCNGVHTFFMKTNIDIILTDKNNIILYIYKNVAPWKIILPKKNVYYTYEAPVNYLNKITTGQKL